MDSFNESGSIYNSYRENGFASKFLSGVRREKTNSCWANLERVSEGGN